jgi:hypothetical protein
MKPLIEFDKVEDFDSKDDEYFEPETLENTLDGKRNRKPTKRFIEWF